MNNKPFSKGLSALIPKKVIKAEPVAHKMSDPVYYMEVHKIVPNPYQPRKEFNLEELQSLAESIRDYGILQPLVVSKNEMPAALGQTAEYHLIAGERRLTAAKMAGLKEVPVIVKQTSAKEKLELSLIENVQRADLNAMEKALAYKKLEAEFRLTQKEIARVAGKSREVVANTLRLLNLPENIQQAVREGKISEGHARAILAAQEIEKQQKVFEKIVSAGLTVREAEDLAQKANMHRNAKKNPQMLQEWADMEDRLKGYLQVEHVKIKDEMGKPKIVITFPSKQQVQDFIKRFSV